jgi:oligoendopeptidase F
MGVAILDMRVWKWMYENPDANAAQLKEAVIKLSKEIWNAYYADVFGSKDEPILAIYSHMIDNPLYLANYPLGHLIELQLEMQLEGKPFAAEVERFFKQGRITPQRWMQGATASAISGQATLKAAEEALKHIKTK